MRPFQGWDGSSILLAATKVMSTQTIELEGFEIELASELYGDRGGDHRELGESCASGSHDAWSRRR